MSLTRKSADRAVARAGYPGADSMFDHDFLVCDCPPTHSTLGIPCAAVYQLAPVGGAKRFRCAQCGIVGAYKAVWSHKPWPRGYEPVLDALGRPRVVGETALARAVATL